jgi:hypothetical protein
MTINLADSLFHELCFDNWAVQAAASGVAHITMGWERPPSPQRLSMSCFVFHCASCRAGIRAGVRLIGRTRACPACGQSMRIRPEAPEESPAILVYEDHSTSPVELAERAASLSQEPEAQSA